MSTGVKGARVSVAMATYNGARFLDEQLQSILKQTRLPDELVITDDNSTDSTIQIANDFAAAAPFPVRVQRHASRLGYNDNFAAAIQMGGGDAIAISDQDDVWTPDHIEKLIAPLEKDPSVSIVIGNSQYVDDSLRPDARTLWSSAGFDRRQVDRLRSGPQFSEWLKHSVLAGHAMAFRASLRPMMLPFVPGMLYDQWIGLICAAVGRIVLIDDIVALHRIHDTQALGDKIHSIADRVVSQPTVRATFFEDQVATYATLRDRLAKADDLVAPDAMQAVRHRWELVSARLAMRQGGALRRLALAGRELISGRYHRAGRGWLTFFRDARG